LTRFPCRPNKKYFLLYFAPVIVGIPALTFIGYYIFILSDSAQDFAYIKKILLRNGTISQKESESFSNKDIMDFDNSYIEKAKSIALQDLAFWNLFQKVILPVLVVLIISFLFTLRVEISGVGHSIKSDHKLVDLLKGRFKNDLPDLSHLNTAIITVDGFIIGLLGASLVSSGLDNFYFFLGFETIIFSLICCLASYPSLFETKVKVEKIEIYFRIVNVASWLLVLGLVFLATSFFEANALL
jgi:hypothetical protein